MNYKNGYNLYAFNFNADQNIGIIEDYINIPKDGFMRLELHFKQNLNTPLKVICYGVFDNTIEIDNNRDVIKDYN